MYKSTIGLLLGLLLSFTAQATVKITPATGGTNLLSDFAAESASPAWSTLGPITITERKKNDFAVGTNVTLVLKAPAGFEFNVASAPSATFAGGKDISSASAAVISSSTLRITYTVSGTAGFDILTIGATQGLQVRPTLISPLAKGIITRPSGGTGGTAIISGVKAAGTKTTGKGAITSFGDLAEVAGEATQLGVQVQPSTNAVMGQVFGRQPSIAVMDSGGNVSRSDNGTEVIATIVSGPGSLLGNVSAFTVNGVATFTNLAATDPGVISIEFSATDLTSVTSAPVTVFPSPPPPGVPTSLSVSIQPSAVNTAGVAFSQQPVIQILDQYDLPYTNDNATFVTVTNTVGDGALQGTLSVKVVNGVATFTNLAFTNATDVTLQFSAASLNSAVAAPITINPANASRLLFDVQPDLAGVGKPFAIQPVIITQDTYGNDSANGLASSLNVTMTLTFGTGTLQGTTVLDIGTNDGNGVVTFTDLSITTEGDKRLTASASGLTNAVSDLFSVVPKTNQTINSFADIPTKTYGDASFALSATASSGLPVTFTVVSGPASITGNTVTITGAGNVTVRASQAGNSNYLAAVSIDQDFAVIRASLVGTGDNATRAYGSVNPTFTGSLTGLVNGEVITATFFSTATTTSIPGNYPIKFTLNDASNHLTNYSVLTNAGTLTITPVLPSITTQPQNRNVGVGGNTSFSVSATGPLLSYQWQLNDAPIAGATASTLTLTSVQLGDAGAYSVIVSNGSGTITSSNATLTVSAKPAFLAQPSSINAIVGSSLSLPVSPDGGFSVTGTQPFTYQWRKGGTALAGQTTSALTLNNVKTTDAGNYSVVLANAAGKATSAPIALTVTTIVAPHIVTNPVSQEVIIGDPVTFTVVAKGSPLNYQWRYNGLPIVGATTSSFTLNSAQLVDSGDYSVSITNTAGSVLSSNATLIVNYDPNVITNDVDLDGHIDVLLQSTNVATNNYLGVWNLAGTNFFDSFLLNDGLPLTSGWKLVGKADFNHDNQIDYLFQNGGFLRVWLMNGTNMVSSVAINTNAFGKAWKVMGARDFNRDGNPDILLRHDLGYVSLWLMNGTKKTKSLLLRGGLAIPPGQKIVGIDDFNKDGSVDLLWQTTKTGAMRIWLMNGIKFKKVIPFGYAPAPVSAWRVTGLVDLDGANSRDVLWQNTNGALFTWFLNGTNVVGSNYLNMSVPPTWSIVGEK